MSLADFYVDLIVVGFCAYVANVVANALWRWW